MFNEKLAERAKQSMWMEVGANVIMITGSEGTPRNVITEYVRLAMEKNEANIQNSIGQSCCQAQNSVQLFHCLTNSMTEAAHLKIVLESDKYIHNEKPVGELLFKLMMQKSIIIKMATSTHMRENLNNLDT